MLNTINDNFFKSNPNKILGEMSIGYQNKIEVKGNKEVVISYFSIKETNNYLTRIKLLEKTAKDNPILIARLKLLKKKNGN